MVSDGDDRDADAGANGGWKLSGTRVAGGRDNEARDWFVLALREMNRVAQI